MSPLLASTISHSSRPPTHLSRSRTRGGTITFTVDLLCKIICDKPDIIQTTMKRNITRSHRPIDGTAQPIDEVTEWGNYSSHSQSMRARAPVEWDISVFSLYSISKRPFDAIHTIRTGTLVADNIPRTFGHLVYTVNVQIVGFKTIKNCSVVPCGAQCDVRKHSALVSWGFACQPISIFLDWFGCWWAIDLLGHLCAIIR